MKSIQLNVYGNPSLRATDIQVNSMEISVRENTYESSEKSGTSPEIFLLTGNIQERTEVMIGGVSYRLDTLPKVHYPKETFALNLVI